MSFPSNDMLAQCARDVYSQGGEDGILERILSVLEIESGWAVEFGAWDGKLFSNTAHLLLDQNWSGVMIEGSRRKFRDLIKTYSGHENVHCLCKMVHFEGPDRLDAILKETPLPREFDVLSIDIDGNDYHVWESLEDYQPKVVVIEYNPTIPNHIEFVQKRKMSVAQGNSIASLVKLGKSKGYELVAVTNCNAIFVQRALYPKFGIEDNTLDTMRTNRLGECYMYQLYDGTLRFEGCTALCWEGVHIQPKKMQVVPKFLRFYSTNSKFKRTLKRLWHYLYSKRLIG